jgi:ABC-type lipoprotein release transport system permease subunit
LIRGVAPIAYHVHQSMQLVSGHWPVRGQGQWVVGQKLELRYPNLAPGTQFHFGLRNWTIVGIFTDGDSARESEIWTDIDDLKVDAQNHTADTSSLQVLLKPGSEAEYYSNADRRNVFIGRLLMREHSWKVGQPLTLRSPSDPRLTLTFIPVFELPTSYLARAFFFNRQLLDDAVKGLYGVDIQTRATFIAVRVDRAENLGAVADSIDESFHNGEFETDTLTESDTLANYVSAIGDVRTIIYALCLVVLMTVLLIAANSMTMLVRDRINEVAVMRALGFTRRHVAGPADERGRADCSRRRGIGAALALWYFCQGVTLGALTGSIGHIEVRVTTAAGAVMVALGVSIPSPIMPVLHAVRIAPAMALREVT